MANCDILPLAPAKACSGKCRDSGICTPTPTVWVLAACEGMGAVFSKQADGHLKPLFTENQCVSSFEDGLRDRLVYASEHAIFTQLVLVGSANDIAWTQASLPAAVSKRVVAEIAYPLMATWFSADPHMSTLARMLGHLFNA